MKKLFLMLTTALLFAGVNDVWGESVTYTFSDYTAGTQYAEDEEHVLDENLTVTTTDCHFTDQLRIYSSSANNGYAVFTSTKAIESIVVNAGNKVDTLNVYTSTDGSTWTLAEEVSITATSYKDYTVNFSTATKNIKLDVKGTNQVRIQKVTVTYAASTGGDTGTGEDTQADVSVVGTLDFGTILVGGTFEPKTLTIEARNIANNGLTADWNPTTSDFSLSGDDALTAVGGTLTITCLATEVGAYTATLKVIATPADGSVDIEKTVTVTATIKEPTGTFVKYEGTELVEGEYVLVGSGTNAMSTANNNGRLANGVATIADGKIVNPDETIVWSVAANSEYYTLYNKAAGAYAIGTGATNKLGLAEQLTGSYESGETFDNTTKAQWDVSYTAGAFVFENVNNRPIENVNYTLRNNSSSGWACYAATTGTAPTLYIKEVPAEDITLAATADAYVGRTLALSATLTPANSTDIIEWTSDKTDVATVDAKTGVVTGVSAGTAVITATAGAVSTTCTVTVKAIEATGISLDVATKEILEKETFKLTATLEPVEATTTIEWSSSNDEIATVDQTGLVTGVKASADAVTITAKAGTHEATCQVTVKAVIATALNLEEETIALQVLYGDASLTKQLTCTLDPVNATDKLEWVSSDDKVAIVDENGLVTAVGAGSATITVKSTVTETLTDACEVTVTDPAITCAEADGIGAEYEHNQYTTDKYVVRGWVKSISGKNIYLSDTKHGEATLYCYSTTVSEGTLEVGNYIQITGILGTYSSNAQMKNGVAIILPTPVIPLTSFELPAELSLYQYQGASPFSFEPANTTVDITAQVEDNAVISFENSVITALAVGTSKVTITAGDETKECVVTVNEWPAIMPCAELAKVVDEGAADKEVTVTGYVTGQNGTYDIWYETGKNASFYMADAVDGGNVFLVYRATPTIQVEKPEIGNKITVTGTVGFYNHVPQIAAGGAYAIIPTAIELDQETITINEFETAKIIATVTPATCLAPITWDYDNTVVSIDDAGVITPLKVGSTTIKATVGDVFDECTITVTRALKGVYTVGGENPNYTSLAAACADVNITPLAGDVTLAIAGDLTETTNSGLINTSNYTVTIRPASETPVTITTAGVDQGSDGPSGALVIGCKSDLLMANATGTKNVVIDGCAEGSTTPSLTFAYTRYSDRIVVYGPATAGQETKDIVIKNIKTTGRVKYAIELRGCNTSGSYILPKNVTIEGCELEATERVIYFNRCESPIIIGNTIRLKSVGEDVHYGLFGASNSGSVIVRGNTFFISTQATADGKGAVAVGASSFDDGWTIENNYFAGMDVLSESAGKIKLIYVRAGNACVIRHNTFYIPVLSNLTTAVADGSADGISCIQRHNTCDVQNNIFVSDETANNNSFYAGTINTFKNNVFYHSGGKAIITKDYADWQAYSNETTGILATNPAAWVNVDFTNAATGDLSLGSNSDGDKALAVPAIAEVTTDINGTARHEGTVYAGAYEGSAFKTDGGTDLENATLEGGNVRKVIENGQVIIIRDGVRYNVMGIKIQ